MRKVSATIVAIIIIATVWYLFFKPQDYRVSFQANALPGTINQTLRTWNQTLEDAVPIQYKEENELVQKLVFSDSIYTYTWKMQVVHDSLSKVDVDITDTGNSLMNRIKVPFFDTDFEKRSRKTLLEFNEFLRDHLDDFKVTLVGEEELFSTFCACVEEKTQQREKASGMMANYSFLNTIIQKNGITMNGTPFIEVLDWDKKKDSLTYNFCYPIIRSEKLGSHPDVFYKRLFNKKAIKAVYNGNYITSDRAWYAILEYAKKNDLQVEEKPVEVFFNNPNMGGGEIRWKTEIYMPLKDSNE